MRMMQPTLITPRNCKWMVKQPMLGYPEMAGTHRDTKHQRNLAVWKQPDDGKGQRYEL